MKKIIFFVFIVGLTLSIANFVSAQEQKKTEINFFYSPTCPHCAKAKIFLSDLEKKYPELRVVQWEVSFNVEKLKEFYKKYNVPANLQGLVPAIFTEVDYFIGFDAKVGQDIESCVKSCIERLNQNCQDCQGGIASQGASRTDSSIINLPILGEINIANYSLPVLAVVLGFLDGFNVCSLGALILILGLVLAFKSRKKILIFGGIFIVTTAVVYGLLITLWYQIFSVFALYLRKLEIIIGILSIVGGVYFLKDFIRFRKYGPICDTGKGNKIISKFSLKIQEFLKKPGNILLVSASVLLFAGIITIIEFPCSAAVPIVFAGVLAKAQLSLLSYVFYIALFLIFYMIDEIIVFLIAFFTLNLWLASPKFVTWITLAEAIILFLLGLYYLFGFSLMV